MLASYALQAEFGDHDTEKHTAEYLQDFPLLPKPMMSQFSDDRLGKSFMVVATSYLTIFEGPTKTLTPIGTKASIMHPLIQYVLYTLTATLTDAIINQHSSLRGIAQQLAEVYYIVGAQQLDGYGQECFLAKDERGNEVLIGASLTGTNFRVVPFFGFWSPHPHPPRRGESDNPPQVVSLFSI